MRDERGFTLVELLVALVIFGMISAAAVALLSFSVNAQATVDSRQEALGDLRRAGALLSSDLGQAVPRLTRDRAGAQQPAFRGGTGAEPVALAFVRRGWENMAGAPRASIQKVEYGLAGGRLERRAYPYADGAEAMAPVAVLDGVRSMRLRYRDRQGEWRDRWDPQLPTELPRAVELVVTLDRGEIRQLFLTGSAA